MKRCLKCKIEKEDSEFYSDKQKRGGLFSYCKPCTTAYNKLNDTAGRQKRLKMKDPERYKNYQREFRKKYRLSHPLLIKNYAKNQKDYLQRLRLSVLEALGGKCVECGFDDKRALQIDHINGGGSKERKTRDYKGNFNKHVLNSFVKGENKYQLLCANCNWIKRVENNERNKII